MTLLANLFWGNVLPSSGMTGLVIEVSPEVPEPADWVVQPLPHETVSVSGSGETSVKSSPKSSLGIVPMMVPSGRASPTFVPSEAVCVCVASSIRLRAGALRPSSGEIVVESSTTSPRGSALMSSVASPRLGWESAVGVLEAG